MGKSFVIPAIHIIIQDDNIRTYAYYQIITEANDAIRFDWFIEYVFEWYIFHMTQKNWGLEYLDADLMKGWQCLEV